MGVLVLVAAAIVAVVVTAAAGARWWTWQSVVTKRVVVQTADAAFNGVVLSRRGPLIVLGDVTVHTAGTTRPIDGTIVIERPHVNWIQVTG